MFPYCVKEYSSFHYVRIFLLENLCSKIIKEMQEKIYLIQNKIYYVPNLQLIKEYSRFFLRAPMFQKFLVFLKDNSLSYIEYSCSLKEHSISYIDHSFFSNINTRNSFFSIQKNKIFLLEILSLYPKIIFFLYRRN